jgi:predicted HTH domain antitoxin
MQTGSRRQRRTWGWSATCLKWALKRGAGDLLLDCACDACRRGQATLSRAAEMAGLSLRELILRMPERDLHLAYSPEDLDQDLERPGWPSQIPARSSSSAGSVGSP